MKLETKRQAAWSWTGTVGVRGRGSTEEVEESDDAGDRAWLSSHLGEDGGELEEEEDGQERGSVVGSAAGLLAAVFLVTLLARLSVAWVSLRCTISNSSL